MKQKYLFNDIEVFRPRFKCGAEIAAAGIAAAGASIFAASTSAAAQAEVNAMSEEQFYSAQRYNSMEAEFARIWQGGQNMLARQWQSEENVKQKDFVRQLIDSQRNYDSLPNQVKLAKAAGFNPSTVLTGAGSVGSGSTFDVPSIPQASSVGSSPVASTPSIPQYKNPAEPLQQGLTGIAQLISSLGQFDQSTAEGEKVRQTTKGFVDLLANQVYGQQMDNAFKSVQLTVSKETSLKNALVDLQNKYFDGMLKQFQGQLFDRQAFLAELQQFTEQAKTKLTNAEYENVQKQVLSFSEAFAKQMAVKDSEISANKASASASYAMGKHYSSLAETENATRQFKVEFEKYHALIEKSTHTVLNATEQQRMKTICNQAINSGFVNELTQQQLRKAIKDNDWYEVGRIMNAVGVLAGVGIALKR